MKVIEHGETYKTARCRCGCLIEYTKVDIKNHVGSFRNDYEITNYIYCPECDNKIILERY